MTSRTTNRYAPEVRDRAVRMVLDHERDYASRWAAVVSIAAKIGCAPQSLHEWVKKTEVDGGRRAGVPTEVAAHPSARSVAIVRGRRICDAGMVNWFNHRRLLEPIGNIPPAEAEERYFATIEQSAMAA